MPITVRPWNSYDLSGLIRYADNPVIERWVDDGFPVPYTEEDGRRFIESTMVGKPRLILAIDLDGEAIGTIGLHRQHNIMRRNLEMGYWIGEPHWGKGYGTEAIRQMVIYGFKTFPNISRIYARPFGSNIGSQRVLEKAGFTLEARLENTIWKHERFEDELIYAVRRPEDGRG